MMSHRPASRSLVDLADGGAISGADTAGRPGADRPPEGDDGPEVKGEGPTSDTGARPEARGESKLPAMMQAEPPINAIVKEPPPPDHSRGDMLKQDILDMATNSTPPDVAPLSCLFREQRIQVLLTNGRMCGIASSRTTMSPTSGSTMRSATPEEARGGVPCNPVERGRVGGSEVHDIDVLPL